uniref:Uncharacterized protein n=1 Tax=Arundo donax TaxID=35708 RepID=A0A0A9EA51_ARUDO
MSSFFVAGTKRIDLNSTSPSVVKCEEANGSKYSLKVFL